ncbi:MAG: ribose 5-phosphate isomerase A [Tannerellaceae bacterium]|nr:ribose 5-phosphate isomerase A [Tannerellaceae bacterium]
MFDINQLPPFWKEIKNREEKEKVGKFVAQKVQHNEVIGAGSGTTSFLALLQINERVQEEGLSIQVIPTSFEIRWTCNLLGLPVTSLLETTPDWVFDGADEIDPRKNMIKGRGGAMFMEKLLIKRGPKTYILADSTKMVSQLGSKHPVPVEIFPYAYKEVLIQLEKLQPKKIELRTGSGKDGPVITESGNLIADVWFEEIREELEQELKLITGVVENGLFIHYPVEILHF